MSFLFPTQSKAFKILSHNYKALLIKIKTNIVSFFIISIISITNIFPNSIIIPISSVFNYTKQTFVYNDSIIMMFYNVIIITGCILAFGIYKLLKEKKKQSVSQNNKKQDKQISSFLFLILSACYFNYFLKTNPYFPDYIKLASDVSGHIMSFIKMIACWFIIFSLSNLANIFEKLKEKNITIPKKKVIIFLFCFFIVIFLMILFIFL
jgi:hypothetical protein